MMVWILQVFNCVMWGYVAVTLLRIASIQIGV